MTRSETYTALLHDTEFGPIVERLEDLQLVDRRPDPVIRRYSGRDDGRWVKVYELDPEQAPNHAYVYVLAYEGPEPGSA